jgi:hypothetical protein
MPQPREGATGRRGQKGQMDQNPLWGVDVELVKQPGQDE